MGTALLINCWPKPVFVKFIPNACRVFEDSVAFYVGIEDDIIPVTGSVTNPLIAIEVAGICLDTCLFNVGQLVALYWLPAFTFIQIKLTGTLLTPRNLDNTGWLRNTITIYSCSVRASNHGISLWCSLCRSTRSWSYTYATSEVGPTFLW